MGVSQTSQSMKYEHEEVAEMMSQEARRAL